MQATAVAAEETGPDSEISPARKAFIDQSQEKILDITPLYARVAGEVITLVTDTLNEADAIDCTTAEIPEGHCPKLRHIAAAGLRVQELIQEFQEPDIG